MSQPEDTQQSSPLLPDPANMGAVRPTRFKTLGKVGFVPGWEGLRGFAVALVMVSHVMRDGDMLGTMGVGIFFVLSGFLITGVLMGLVEKQQLQQTNKSRYAFLPRFYLDRFVRLSPALAIMVGCFTYIKWIPAEPLIAWDALSAFFYVHNYYPTNPGDPIVIFPGYFLNTWSLAVEEQFYIFWSIVIVFVIPLNVRKRAVVLGVLIASSFCMRWYAGYAFRSDHMYGIDYRYAYSTNAFKMFIGCAARLLPMPTFSTRPIVGKVAFAILCALVYVWGWVWDPIGYDLRTNGCWLELFTCFISLLVVTGSINGNAILEGTVLRFLGRISYSLYLWQFPVNAWYNWPVNDYAPTGLAFTIATFTTFVIEEPIRNAYHAHKLARQARAQSTFEKAT